MHYCFGFLTKEITSKSFNCCGTHNRKYVAHTKDILHWMGWVELGRDIKANYLHVGFGPAAESAVHGGSF